MTPKKRMDLVSVHREKSLQYSRYYRGKLILHYSHFPVEGLYIYSLLSGGRKCC